MDIKSFLRNTGALVVLAASLNASAQMPAATAPELQVGDSWKYRIIDRWNEKELRQTTVTTMKITDETVSFEMKRSDREQADRVEATRELNRKRDFGNKYQSDSGWLKFPLQVGKRWTNTEYWRNSKNNLGKDEIEREVVAYERIRVPAGEFDAYKIVGKGFWSGIEFSSTGRREQTIWYAPAIKRFVRFDDMATGSSGGIDWQTREELVEFKLH